MTLLKTNGENRQPAKDEPLALAHIEDGTAQSEDNQERQSQVDDQQYLALVAHGELNREIKPANPVDLHGPREYRSVG